MFELVFKIEGETQIARVLTRVEKNLSNFYEPLSKSKDLLLRDVDLAFRTEGKIFGGWAPLSPEYAAWKAQRYPGRGILERTGKMRKSFRSTVTSHKMEIWNSVGYFPYHQSNRPRTKLPRRVMLYIRPESRREIVKIFQEYLLK